MCLREPRPASNKDDWTPDALVYFTGGMAYGFASNGDTVCLGVEANIKGFYDKEDIPLFTNPLQKEVWNRILEIRRGEGYGKQTDTIKSASPIRSRTTRTFQHREGSLKQPALKQGASLR